MIIRHTAHISPTGRESGGSRCRRDPGSGCAGRIGVGEICGRSGTRSRGEDVVLSSIGKTPIRPIQGRSIESGNVVSFCLVNVLKVSSQPLTTRRTIGVLGPFTQLEGSEPQS